MIPQRPLRQTRRRQDRRTRGVVAVLAASLLWFPAAPWTPNASASVAGPKPTTSDKKLRELQADRDRVRATKAKAAAKVNALQATDAEIEAALADLNNNIEGQNSLLEEAQRAVAAAEAEQVAAEAAEAQALADLGTLQTNIKDQAIRAYVSPPTDDTLALLSADSLADAARHRTLLEVRTGKDLDAAERFRTVKEDLGIAREASAAAAARASERRGEVSDRLTKLESAQAEQEKFSADVEQRLEAQLAEAASLAEFDGALSSQITTRQGEIAKQLAAQRAAAARRSKRAPASEPSGSVTSLPNLDGAGIVTVRGIRVDGSIAGNLESMLAAAEAAGISMSGGGYRNPAGQIAVRRSNCGGSTYAIYQMPASSCSPPTARPGSSMHERGLAIDFTQGGRTLNRGSSAFAWLKANAASYGFRNLPSEPWHWSTNGN